MRVLTFTTLYPNAARPHHGVFVENRLRHLAAMDGVEPRVLAPVPWFPSGAAGFGRYGAYGRAPRREERFAIDIDHPRYLAIPRVGMTAAPLLLYAAARSALGRMVAQGYEFDLIDAHYFYPDGVAAALLGRHFGKPVTITARGSDIGLIPRHAMARRMIRWAAGQAAGLIAVCQALKDAMVGLGIDEGRITVLRNGVDLALFHEPDDRAAARRRLGIDGPTLLSVGHLVERKGHDLAIGALAGLADVRLSIVGEGPEEAALKALARRLGVEGRVRFLGRVAHEELPAVYGAADALVLASSREGWANVLLEAMACGTPVVASDVWGTPEIVAAPAAGVLMAERSAAGVAEAVRALFADAPPRAATRAYAEGFGWDDTSRGQFELFQRIIKDKTV